MLESPGSLRVISGRKLLQLVPMADAINAVREAFVSVSGGRIEQLPRTTLSDGSLLTMVAGGYGSSGACLKVIGVRQDPNQTQFPLINALVLWFDLVTGQPLALIEGNELTALRTGAASGVATDLLGAPDATVLTMIGSGAQAASQVQAVCTVRRIEMVRVFSRNGVTAASLCERLSQVLPKVEFRVCPDISSAVQDADVICTATTATAPLILSRDLKQRVHINAVGAYRPNMCEISSEVIAGASVVAVDHLPAALEEAGDLLQSVAAGQFAMHDAIELGVLAGKPKGMQSGWTIFKSVGIAAQDWAIAKLAVERSRGSGVPKIKLKSRA
jgi:ornithine cyclodeaminase/alanine dehydrogenase-like protein (mu-crystallin family)